MTSKTGRIRLPDREGSSATGSRVITPTFVREGIDGSDLSPIYQARWNNTVRSIRAAGVSVDAEVAWAFVDTDGNQYADGSVSEGSIVFESDSVSFGLVAGAGYRIRIDSGTAGFVTWHIDCG
jgi:hypothetical protein